MISAPGPLAVGPRREQPDCELMMTLETAITTVDDVAVSVKWGVLYVGVLKISVLLGSM